MSSEFTLKLDPERVREMPMVDLAFEVLKAANTPFYYRDLITEIAKIRGLSDEELDQVIAQIYTEINIDGRFACVGGNTWGLKRWYPVERSEDSVTNAKRPRIINDDDDLDDEDLYTDEEVDSYAGDDDGFDIFDDDTEDLFDEADEDVDVDDDVVVDDEELEDEALVDEFENEVDEEEEVEEDFEPDDESVEDDR
ncbi:DNA-directed RNA polymerase subunit delta [Paenibacillus cisolokensis]|uniref:Probable DNA-directed RNA polymerase subunit delta n=1 Tax=Paenibacillus cisolokensis TaxID=1658519 RepID=A0ABQ4N9S3_9BACL|nr:DNA-directed RNA polymerase subunit delta [Paenibacillus cisolokensis]GIQ64941.1 hypothetical protein PACILC2_35090 [Paenibacillus cisolokensis]